MPPSPVVLARPERHTFQGGPIVNHVDLRWIDAPACKDIAKIFADHNDPVACACGVFIQPDEILANQVADARQLAAKQPIRGNAVDVLNPGYESHTTSPAPARQAM